MKSLTLSNLVKNINLNILAAAATTLILVVLVFLFYTFIPQELNLELIKENFITPIGNFVAEQAERASYVTSVLLVIPLFSLFYFWFNKKINIKDNIKFLNKISSSLTLFCIFVLFLFMATFFLYDKDWFLIPFILLACLSFYYKDKPFLRTDKANKIYLIIAMVFIARILYIYLTKDIVNTYFEYVHFSIFAYPIFKVQNGLTLNIDFNNIYGYYPYFYSLFSKIFGAWNITKILNFNILLLLFCWLTFGFSIKNFIKNKLLFLIAFVLFVYLTGGQGIYYLQTFPLRLVNFVLIWFIASVFLYSKEKRQKILTALGFLWLCLGIVWNFETGIISLIAWTVFLIYCQALRYTVKDKIFYKNTLIYILSFILTLAFAAAIFLLIPYVRTGRFVPLEDILWGTNLFYKTGYYMLKIKPYHPWFVPLAFYFISLILALNPVLQFRKCKKPFLPFLFLTTLIGIGFYTYYQGRSHLDCLISVLFPLSLIVVLFIDKLPVILKLFSFNKNLTSFQSSLKMWNSILCITSFTFFFFAFYSDFIVTPYKDDINLYKTHKDFIMSVAQKGKVLMITNGSAVFYQLTGQKDDFPFPPNEDLVLKRDYNKILTYLEQNDNVSVMFTDRWLQSFEGYDMPRLKKIQEKREKIVNSPITLYKSTGE